MSPPGQGRIQSLSLGGGGAHVERPSPPLPTIPPFLPPVPSRPSRPFPILPLPSPPLEEGGPGVIPRKNLKF